MRAQLAAVFLVSTARDARAAPIEATRSHIAASIQPLPADKSTDTTAAESADSAAAFAESQGEVYKPAKLLGPSLAYNLSTTWQLPITACAALAATIDRHTFWFKGSNEEDHSRGPVSAGAKVNTHLQRANSLLSQPVIPALNQQDAERRFVEEIGSSLCTNPAQSDDEYTAKCPSPGLNRTQDGSHSRRSAIRLLLLDASPRRLAPIQVARHAHCAAHARYETGYRSCRARYLARSPLVCVARSQPPRALGLLGQAYVRPDFVPLLRRRSCRVPHQ